MWKKSCSWWRVNYIILHCPETNCFYNVEVSKMLSVFNMKWLVPYTNQAFSSLKTMLFLSLFWREDWSQYGKLHFTQSSFQLRWPEIMNIDIKKEWVVTCLCQCLIFIPSFSMFGTVEWEISYFIWVFTTQTSGSLSDMCLLWSVLEWWPRDSSYKETNCLNEGGIQLFLLAALKEC